MFTRTYVSLNSSVTVGRIASDKELPFFEAANLQHTLVYIWGDRVLVGHHVLREVLHLLCGEKAVSLRGLNLGEHGKFIA